MAAIRDQHAPFAGAPEGPYRDGFAISPSDANDLPQVTAAIHVGTAVNLRCVTQDGSDITIALTAGWHRIRLTKVFSTSTTASGISGWV